MWLITTSGFLSAVASQDSDTDLLIRVRHREDLNALMHRFKIPKNKVLAYAGSDYAFRIVIPKADFATFVAEQALAIDYSNFKSEVTKRQGIKRHDIYMQVWTALLAVGRLPGAERGRAKALRQTPDRPSRWALPSWTTSNTLTFTDDDLAQLYDNDWFEDEPRIDWVRHADCSRHGCVHGEQDCPV